MAGRSELDPHDYLPLVQTLARVGPDLGDFTVGEGDCRKFGLRSSDLAALADAGLPHLRIGDERLFRWGDLHYLGLRLGTARSYLSGIRRWAKAFARLSRSAATEIEVDYTPRLDAAPSSAVLGTVALPGGARQALPLRSGVAGTTARARQRGLWPDPDARLAAVLDRFAEVELYVIPPSLRGSAQQLLELGLSDCESAARLAAAACAHEGYETRAAYGLLISFPFSIPHSWTEVLVDGTWMSFDPLTAGLMREFARDDVAGIAPSSCLGAMLLRICGEPVALVSVGGVAVDASFATRLAR